MSTSNRRKAMVTIYRGDDLDKLQQLRTAVQDASPLDEDSPQLGDEVDPHHAAAEEYNSFLAEAKERAFKIRLEALSRLGWRSLVKVHPPRETTVKGKDGEESTEIHADDQAYGVNEDTFPDALVPASVISVESSEPVDAQDFIADLSDADFYRLYAVAMMLNIQAADPKALPGSVRTPTSDET